MAHVIKLKDGKTETIFDIEDIFYLMDEYMGDEITAALREKIAGDQDLEKAYDDLYEELQKREDHHRTVMDKLRRQSEVIANLIAQKDIDRRALSMAAGKIGIITWRELS